MSEQDFIWEQKQSINVGDLVQHTWVREDNHAFVRAELVTADGDRLFAMEAQLVSPDTPITPIQFLPVAWLGINMSTPLADRTESLSDHGLSNTGFLVSPVAIEIAKAYRDCFNKDITEAV